ncbi:MAG: DUF4139 domain-containing protein [Litoreibacter sp.]
MKFLPTVFVALSVFATPTLAIDIQTLAPVRAATVYPNGATVTRVVTAEVPAGSHRVLFPIPNEALDAGPPRIRATTGFQFGAQELLTDYITDPETVFNEAQKQALDNLENAKESRQVQSDRVVFAEAKVHAASAQIEFLRSISGNSLEDLDPTALAETAGMISEQVASGLAALQSAREALRAGQKVLRDLDKLLAQAQRDFDRTSPPDTDVTMMAISIDVDTAQNIEFTLDYLTRGASWTIDYDLFLTRGDDPTLDVSRKILIKQSTYEVWDDIALVLSTADPSAQIDPREVYPSQASIFERQVVNGDFRTDVDVAADRNLKFAETIEERVIIEETSTFAPVAVDGLSISYPYPERVTVMPDEGYLILALGTFELAAETSNRAAPRLDDTAFLMAEFTNTTSEPMLPGTTSLYRDGAFVGRGRIEMIPAGAEETLAFGPLENLRLDFKLLANDTGDVGIISRSDQRQQSMEFSVENLTDDIQLVETLFALPFSEQEDLDISVRARPQPESDDFEKRRNVKRWELELEPGQKQIVQLDVTLDWPQGKQLNWRP